MIFGVLSSPVPGHMIPLSALSRELIRRGHHVIFFSLIDTENFLKKQGVETTLFGKKIFPEGAWKKRWGPLSSLHGKTVTLKTLSIHKDVAKAMCCDIPKLIKQNKIKYLIIDQVQFHGRAIADVCKISFCTFSCAHPMNLSKILPPPTENGIPSLSPFKYITYSFQRFIFRMLIANTNIAEACRLLKQHKMKSYTSPKMSYSKAIHIIPSLTSCDILQSWQSEKSVYYTGAFIEKKDEPITKSEKPLIYISLGTLQNGDESLFQTIIEGASQKDNEIIIGMGEWNESQNHQLPSNVTVLPMAPQQKLLAKASLCISHGGFNTYNEALFMNTPLLIIPIANDQFGVASRVAHLGFGKYISRNKATPKKISHTINQILGDKTILQKVKNVSKKLRRSGGISEAADLILKSINCN